MDLNGQGRVGVDEFQQRRKSTLSLGARAQQPFAVPLQQLAKCLTAQRPVGHLAQIVALIAQDPRFADWVVPRQLEAEQVAQPPAPPESSLEDRLEAKRSEW